jgi:hypothetical protein
MLGPSLAARNFSSQKSFSPFLAGLIPLAKNNLPIQKKVEARGAPQNRRIYGKMECLPLRPIYTGEKTRTLGKT